jgi:hypothetical protein
MKELAPSCRYLHPGTCRPLPCVLTCGRCQSQGPFRSAVRKHLGLPSVRLSMFGYAPSVERVLHLVSGSMDLVRADE